MGKEVSHGYVKWFSELNNKDIPIAGGKGASLAEMYRNKFPVPPGFVITAQAYAYFIEKAGLKDKIQETLSGIDFEDTKELDRKAKEVRELIVKAELPADLEQEIRESYDILDVDQDAMKNAHAIASSILKKGREPVFVAVRSSATTEDLVDASFAGQQESFLNVKGASNLIENVKKCFASLFTARAVYYRNKKGFGQDKALLAVVVQKMIPSDKSGVMFSKNPVSNKEEIMIESVFGLGEGIVSGMIKPDNYIVDGNVDEFKLLSKQIAEKKIAIARDSSGENKIFKLTEDRSKQQVLTEREIKVLAQLAKRLEKHYGKPQDIEFAISGLDIYIVQSRPITTLFDDKEKKELKGDAILTGLGASPGISSGTVKVVHSLEELSKVKKGDVLVTEMTNPDMVVDMQKASGIITDEGGITSHAAIVSREMGIPCVVGTEKATKNLKDGDLVTVDGFSGKVYAGKGEEKKVEIRRIAPTRTKIKVIVDLPDYAPRAALSGAKAVGLVRLEGIIAESGKHPFYYVKNKKMMEYVNTLVSGLSKIADHFEEVWIRSSDIRSDEYQHLEGAPKIREDNPMLGNHGIRFSLKHEDILGAEIMAVKMLAEKYKDKIFGFMMPQIISVKEVKRAKEIALEVGLDKSKEKNVKFGIMVETPAAVQVINELCEEGIDFVSFGTNDLTQYILAIDRNNQEIQDLYNEMNPAVLSALSYVIRRCKKHNVETSICGQAASKPEMAAFLVKEGIDSVSVNADAAYNISKIIGEIENSGVNEKGDRDDGGDNEKDVKKEDDEQKDNKVDLDNMGEKVMEHEVGQIVQKEAGLMHKDMEEIVLNELEGGSPEAKLIKEMEREAGLIVQNESVDGIIDKAEDMAVVESARVIVDSLAAEVDKHENDQYDPGFDNGKKDIPNINEAIPVDSDLIDEEVADGLKDAKEFDLDNLIYENELKADKKLDIF